ncbi:MAG: PDZ domain-containing protein, partial [Verrucomicrobiota bacterium]|nr:PDZ domain-containing protein [Verrucomicrobiota bacterium]
FAGNLTLDLVGEMKRPDYIKVERGNRGKGTRNEMRAYTGVIPDYASEEKGLLINDVRAGGPADKAGIKSGDIVVQFGEKKINNIYDYTEALNDIKIGKPVKVVVMRKKKKVELTITPEARK